MTLTCQKNPYEIIFKGATDTPNPFIKFYGDYNFDIYKIELNEIELTQTIKLIIPAKV